MKKVGRTWIKHCAGCNKQTNGSESVISNVIMKFKDEMVCLAFSIETVVMLIDCVVYI